MRLEKPDPGLVKAFKVCQIPECPAVDLGCGHGRNAILMAQFGHLTTGYELNSEFQGEADKLMQDSGVTFEFKFADALRLEFQPESLAVVGVGMTIYNPKDVVEDLLQSAYGWLMPGGILHVEFATFRDASLESDFVQMGCWQDPERPGSFVHCCESYTCYLYGKNGGSFWEKKEASKLIQGLGQLKFIHRHTREWVQAQTSADGGIEKYRRSFYQVTAQKVR